MAIEQAPLEMDLRQLLSRRRNLKALYWLCGWGGAAAIALTALAITSQTKSATERFRSIFAVTEPAAVAQMPSRVSELESETQMLIAQVRLLTADRDRLTGRIGLLESSIDDMTGAIKRQAAVTAAALAAKAAPVAAPAPAAPATTRPALPSEAGVNAQPLTSPSSSKVATAMPAAQPEVPPRDSVPLPQSRSSTLTAAEPASSADGMNEFALDLGGGPTLDAIRQRWITVKASFGPLLSGMRPLAARERRPGVIGYRLVVGPLPNSPAATGLCAHFNAARTACHATKFDGEQIAIAQH
jgi:hypothetical protein